jgi:hypothetical protein
LHGVQVETRIAAIRMSSLSFLMAHLLGSIFPRRWHVNHGSGLTSIRMFTWSDRDSISGGMRQLSTNRVAEGEAHVISITDSPCHLTQVLAEPTLSSLRFRSSAYSCRILPYASVCKEPRDFALKSSAIITGRLGRRPMQSSMQLRQA